MLNSNFSCLCSLALCTSSTTCLGSCCTGLPSQSWSIYLWQHSRVLISSIGGERGLTFALLFCFFFLVQCYDWLYWKQTIESKKWLSVISYFFRLPETARDCQTTLDWPLKLHWNMDYTAVYRVFLVTWYSEDTHTDKKKNHSIFGVQITTSAAKRFINSIKQQHRLPRTDIGSMKVFKTWLKKTSSDLLPPWDFPSTLPTRVILQSFEWSL